MTDELQSKLINSAPKGVLAFCGGFFLIGVTLVLLGFNMGPIITAYAEALLEDKKASLELRRAGGSNRMTILEARVTVIEEEHDKD